MLQATVSLFMFFHTRQVLIPMNAVFFWGKRSSHDTLTRVEKRMLTTSRLLPTPDVNISHHIMRQALEHEAACGSLGGTERVEAERKQEKVEGEKKGRE